MHWPQIIKKPLNKKQIKEVADEFFGDMIKIAVDIEEAVVAVGCSLHADAEQQLLRHGSKQESVWGVNYFPDRPQGKRLEYTALMNIRPRQGNSGQFIQSLLIRKKIEGIIGEYFDL